MKINCFQLGKAQETTEVSFVFSRIVTFPGGFRTKLDVEMDTIVNDQPQKQMEMEKNWVSLMLCPIYFKSKNSNLGIISHLS